MKLKLASAISASLIGVTTLSSLGAANSAVTIIQLATPTVVTLEQKTVLLKPPVSNSPGAWSVEISNPKIATSVGLQVTLLSVGSTVIRYVQEAAGGYNASAKHSRLTVNPGIPLLGEFKNQTAYLAQNFFTLTPPTSTSDGPWSFQSLNSQIATVSDRTVFLKDGGEVRIRATQNANSKWAAATTEMLLTVSAPSPVLGSFSDISLSIDSVSRVQLAFPSSNSKGAWSLISSDPSVAAIEGTSIVARKSGVVEITAYQAPLGGFRSASAKIKVTITAVNPAVATGEFKDATIELDLGTTKNLVLKSPTSSSPGSWSFTSSNSGIASISGAVLTALKPGTIQVTATQAASGNYASVTAAPITIKILAKQTLQAPLPISKLVGDPVQKIAFPASASSGAWSAKSSNTEIVTVIEGNLSFVGAGKAIISITQAATESFLSNTLNFEVTVIGLPPTLGTFSPIQVGVGETLGSIQLPTSNSKGKWVFTINDPSIASINGGILTGLKVGSTLISAYQEPLGKYGQSSTIQTNVTVKPLPVVANFPNVELTLGLPAKEISSPASSSTGAWTYSSSAPGIVSASGSSLKPVAVGTAIITAQQLPTPQFAGISKTFQVLVKPTPEPKASASLAGRVITVYVSNPLNSAVSVKINSAQAKVGKNSVLPGKREVVVWVGGKAILTKVLNVK